MKINPYHFSPNKLEKTFLFTLLWIFCLPVSAHKSRIDWGAFLYKHDLVFQNLSTQWHEGAFTGNGLLGTMLYLKDYNTLRLDVGRTDVYDQGSETINKLFSKARLPIGHFTITPSGKIQEKKLA